MSQNGNSTLFGDPHRVYGNGNLTQNGSGNHTQIANLTQNGDAEDVDAIFSIYGDPHRMFVQSMMSRSIISATEFTALFELIFKKCNIHMRLGNIGERQKKFILTCNKMLEEKCNMKILKVLDEESPKKISFLVLTNRADRSKDTNKLTIKDQFNFAPHELEYLKLVLNEIMENPMRQVKSTKALNIAKNLDKSTKKIQAHEAEAILQKFKNHNWLRETSSGTILLSTRFIYEMEPFLKETYPEYVGKCILCRKIAIRFIECPNENCDSQFHAYCAKGIEYRCNQLQCKSTLPERRQDNGHRQTASTSGQTQNPSTSGQTASTSESPERTQTGQNKRKRIIQMDSDSD